MQLVQYRVRLDPAVPHSPDNLRIRLNLRKLLYEFFGCHAFFVNIPHTTAVDVTESGTLTAKSAFFAVDVTELSPSTAPGTCPGLILLCLRLETFVLVVASQ